MVLIFLQKKHYNRIAEKIGQNARKISALSYFIVNFPICATRSLQIGGLTLARRWVDFAIWGGLFADQMADTLSARGKNIRTRQVYVVFSQHQADFN
jgi:hypothetical protein